MLTATSLRRTGVDAVALKPAEHDLERALELGVDAAVVDYEGREHLPDPATFEALASSFDCYVTTPVRANGFDPLGSVATSESSPSGSKPSARTGVVT